MNPNDRDRSTRVFHREYKDAVGNIHTEYKDADGNIYTEYKDINGNIHVSENRSLEGQLVEEQIEDVRTERADTNISKGLLIGVIVTCVTGLTAGLIYFLTRPNNPQPAAVMNVPTYESTQAPSPPPPQQVRVVEQPIVNVVPVPQTQASGSTENTTTQSSKSNESSKPGNTNAANPAKKPSPSVQPVVNPTDSNAASANLSRTDSQIKNEILTRFKTNLPNNQLIVDVKNGDVTVSGKAATSEQLQAIELLLGSIKGIGTVNITASAPPKM